MTKGTDTDYWFLRRDGIAAKTALRMLAIAYKAEEQSEETNR